MKRDVQALKEKVKEDVKDYYGKVLETNQDLKTSACCPLDPPPRHIQPLLKNIHPQVEEKFYGCGSPLPVAINGCTVLDLGCGSGRDAYLLSQLVGAQGKVIGIDMTDEQLAVAREHIDWHTQQFGYTEANVIFTKGYIEDLADCGLEDNSIDVVISNCVINLSADKLRIFNEIARILKSGGELYFSDVFADRRIPQVLRENPLLIGECLGGALYQEDFRRLLTAAGINDARVISERRLSFDDPEIKQLVGEIGFYSVTIRAFKCPLEETREDYGQSATYLGTLNESPKSFIFDRQLNFKVGEPMPVCSNTIAMLKASRLEPYFKINDDGGAHRGPFPINGRIGPLTENPNKGCC